MPSGSYLDYHGLETFKNQLDAIFDTKLDASQKGANNGVATLGADGKVTSSQLPTAQDISGKADKVSNATNGNFAGLDSNGNLVDSGKKATDFGTYSKPLGGIPLSDLTSAVQTSLGKADTAYQKPNGGIPASDIASGVIPTVHNVPAGGSTGQVLKKVSGSDYDVAWGNDSGGGGGGGGTSDYTDLENKPQINSVTLSGNKSLSDLGIAAASDIPDVTGKADKVSNAVNGNFAALTNSGNLVDSGKKATDFGTYSKPLGGIPDSDLAETYIKEPYLEGTNGQVLTTNGDGGRSWTTIQGSGGSYSDLTNKPQINSVTLSGNKSLSDLGIAAASDIPDVTGKADKVTSATNGNFAALNSSGNLVDSGHKHSDYLTAHQNISGKADKVVSATSGNFAALDANGNLTDSGHKHSDYLTSSNISGKADKVVGATNGNFASLNANGNLVDSGHKHSDYLTSHQDISGKADKVTSATNGNFASLNASGNLVDSGHKHSDYLTSHQDISGKADKVVGGVNGNFVALNSSGNLVDSGHKHSDYLTSHQDISGKIDKPSNPEAGAFLVFNGSIWDAQILSTWQGGSY